MARPSRAIPILVVLSGLAAVAGRVRAADDVCTPASGPIFTTDIGRQTLPANDGWASTSPGTTGGTLATDANIFTVTNRAQLVAALGPGGSTTARIIKVQGTID